MRSAEVKQDSAGRQSLEGLAGGGGFEPPTNGSRAGEC